MRNTVKLIENMD